MLRRIWVRQAIRSITRLVIVDPIVSIVLSAWIFGEYFTDDALRLAIAVVAFASMAVSVIVLTRTAPSSMAPTASATTS